MPTGSVAIYLFLFTASLWRSIYTYCLWHLGPIHSSSYSNTDSSFHLVITMITKAKLPGRFWLILLNLSAVVGIANYCPLEFSLSWFICLFSLLPLWPFVLSFCGCILFFWSLSKLVFLRDQSLAVLFSHSTCATLWLSPTSYFLSCQTSWKELHLATVSISSTSIQHLDSLQSGFCSPNMIKMDQKHSLFLNPADTF